MTETATIREFRWSDLEVLTRLFNEITGRANGDGAYDTELMAQVLSQPASDPEKNCYLAELGGSPVGYALISPEAAIRRAVASGGVLESHRNRGIGRALLSRSIVRAAELDSSVLHIQVPDEGGTAQRLMERCRFRRVRRYAVMRWRGTDVPLPDLHGGCYLRCFEEGEDEEALTELQNASFEGSWGFCPNTVEEITARLSLKTAYPCGLVFVADGVRLVAYNWTFRSAMPKGSTGWIGMTGVHPEYRGRGLGRAVLLAGITYLTENGVRTVELEVDDLNRSAKELYSSAGFREVGNSLWYERSLGD